MRGALLLGGRCWYEGRLGSRQGEPFEMHRLHNQKNTRAAVAERYDSYAHPLIVDSTPAFLTWGIGRRRTIPYAMLTDIRGSGYEPNEP